MQKKIILLSTIVILNSYAYWQDSVDTSTWTVSNEITSTWTVSNETNMNGKLLSMFKGKIIIPKDWMKIKWGKFTNVIKNFKYMAKDFSKKMNNNIKDFVKDNMKEIHQNWLQFHEEFGVLKDYIDSNLSTGDKEELTKKIFEMNHAMKDLEKEFRQAINSWEDTSVIIEKIISNKKEFLDSIRQYVNEDMIDSFDEFVSNWIDVKQENLWMRMENKEKAIALKSKILKRRAILSDKLIKSVEKKLDSIPDNKKEVVLNKILTNLEKARTKVSNLTWAKKEKMLNIIDEVEKIVREKLSGNDVDNEDETLVNEILNI